MTTLVATDAINTPAQVWDIHGGIHPNENKSQSLSKKITPLPVPPQLILPLSQHIGVPAKPIVKVGERVLKGQCIAEAVGPVSVPIHAPSSGTITAIESRDIPHPSGLQDRCIIIDTDGKDEWRERHPNRNYRQLEKPQLVQLIRNGGISGMGGAGFPASVKLNTRDNVVIDTLIINGTECEPYITADHVLMRERVDAIAEGIAILAQLVKPSRILIGIEDNKPDVIVPLQTALAQFDFTDISGQPTDVKVVTFPTKYPSGGEKQLIQILTGKQVPSGGLPADLGIVCQNIGTTVAIRNAVCDDEPLISRITTVTGEAINQPQNVEVLLGTPIHFLLSHAQYDASKNNRLIMGGPMMGFALASTDIPIVKTTNCILAPSEQELPTPPPHQACIRCGMCAEVCPVSLLPQQLYWFSQGKELDKLEAHNIADCIECGACSYVCPSNIPLVQYYRSSKADIRQRKIDHQSAEASKVRFDARQERLERLENEKIAARKARQEKAKAAAALRAAGEQSQNDSTSKTGDDGKAAEIQAALARVQAKKAVNTQLNEHTKSQPSANQDTETEDPIARAIAKRESQKNHANADPQAQLVETVDKAKARLEKAKQRLENAIANDDANISAFKTGAEKAMSKFDAAQQALEAFRTK